VCRVQLSCFALPNSFSALPRATVQFSCFALPDSFSAVPRSSVPFSYFALPNTFSAVSWASSPFFMFCIAELIFGGTEGVGSRFHVLLSRTHFRWYLGRRVPFSCFALPNSFSAVPCASRPIFMSCALGRTEGLESRIHVFRSRTRFRRYRRRRDQLSCFALQKTFSAVLRAPCPVFMFCATRLVFGGTKGVGSRFLILHSRSRFRRFQGRRVQFSCLALSNSY
jgi:hypothetical protein